ncbi:hypothetical protein R5W23_004337 [Gemmata sp. JC673]|uniref:SWIM-type domain-containing protein n=1 Tax=Gemmata algarum TaxID=2975278 RepID=A0ABU5F7U6_9BACT|nr:hypothetical protein [Gemmata algarum]MDY3562857.1 hypothetical protein [Gemmata algarum]
MVKKQAPEAPERYAIVTVVLPGPDRKRAPAPYLFRVTYRNPDPDEPGCLMTWVVSGGREEYQIAAERTADGYLNWHCTCPDAVYHGEHRHAYCCKHVHGLQALFDTIGPPVRRERSVA